MKQSRHSFRAARIGLLGCSDQDRVALTRQLTRLGAVSVPLDAVDESHLEGEDRLRALFLDGDADISDRTLPADAGRRIAIIALVGSEAPSHLNRILRQSISAHLMKPVRSVGIMTALSVASQTFRTHGRLAEQVERLETRLKQRRHVFAAQLALMNELGLDEEAAFARLRGAAMERRMTIEEFSVALLGRSEPTPAERRDLEKPEAAFDRDHVESKG
jgi:AmiR/NasT family two-component response regulator